jgi:hypothetical protein
MATLNFTPHEHGVRRLVLIDFDWMDADLIPELLRHPGLSVRLMAGACADDPGMRVAELCGVPRTLELGDLTRELFDIALVGEESARRAHVSHLFQALGTPVVSPQVFLGGVRGFERRRTPRVSPRAEAMSVLVGDDVAALIDHAIPDLGTTETEPEIEVVPPPWSAHAHPMPLPSDRLGLERLVAQLAHQTGAFASALLVRRGEGFAFAATNGADDPLLRALGELALRIDAPQVVCRMNGTRVGKVWGAWPFRTREHRAALLAAGLETDHGAETWERAAFALRYAWDRAGAEQAGSPEDRYRNTWLTPVEFRSRMRLAVERHHREGRRFAIHRLHVDGAPGTVEVLCQRMPDHLRATDCLCRPAAGVILLLVSGTASEYVRVRERIAALWSQCWLELGGAPAPPIGDERIELASRDDAEVFVAAASAWLAAD